jgi:hypothetical protein
MPHLNGPLVRRQAELRGWSLADLGRLTNIPTRTLENTTRTNRPDPMRAYRVERLRVALGVSMKNLVANNEGVPDEPPPQPKPKRTGPTRRQERETDNRRTGPRRAQGRAA